MILCVDPGYANYGYIILDTTGTIVEMATIKTSKTKIKTQRISDDNAYRISVIAMALHNVIQTYNIKAVLGEMPGSGSKSASAMKAMAMATAISVSVFAILRLPVEWTTPMLVKQALTGSKTASKYEMMAAACKLYNWKVERKHVGKSIKSIYYPLGTAMPANTFEHIADAIGVYAALKEGNICKMYIK